MEHMHNPQLQAQLDRVLSNPDDDAEHLVYADMLTEAGDTRGEFIVLQLLSDPSEQQARRIDELIKTHATSFTGRLEDLLSKRLPIFNRNFLVDLDLHSTNVFDLTPLAEFKNLELLDVGSTEVFDLDALQGLTKLKGLDLSYTEVFDLVL